MRKKQSALLLVLCLSLSFAALGETDAYLSGSDLKALEPAYEAFLNRLADTLIEKGLLPEADREAWLLYQLGDFLQNGGYGSIVAMYTPGLLSMADESVAMRRFQLDTPRGKLQLNTLKRYSPLYSSLPGLPLDAELHDGSSPLPVACRFRWTVTGGMLMIWDGNGVVEVGSTYTSDGRPLYWSETPVEGCREDLRLELLRLEEDVAMASITLTVVSEGGCWLPEALQ